MKDNDKDTIFKATQAFQIVTLKQSFEKVLLNDPFWKAIIWAD